MTEEDRTRLLTIASTPIASITLVDLAWTLTKLEEHPDEIREFAPELAALL